MIDAALLATNMEHSARHIPSAFSYCDSGSLLLAVSILSSVWLAPPQRWMRAYYTCNGFGLLGDSHRYLGAECNVGYAIAHIEAVYRGYIHAIRPYTNTTTQMSFKTGVDLALNRSASGSSSYDSLLASWPMTLFQIAV